MAARPAASTEAMPNAPRPRRPRRFALPAHDDHRAVDAIDALLGPRNRPEPDLHEADRGRGRALADTVFGGLDSRLAFLEAARREDDRVRRYRRPAAVAVLAVAGRDGPPSATDLERGSWRLIDAVTRIVRSTDRVARVGPDRLHLLLPETRQRPAEQVVERIRARWTEQVDADSLPLSLVTAVSTATATDGVIAALDAAERTVATTAEAR